MTIGGNESDSIRKTRVELDASGMVRQHKADPFICVVQDLKIGVAAQAAEEAIAARGTVRASCDGEDHRWLRGASG